jgi:hypothetical protein
VVVKWSTEGQEGQRNGRKEGTDKKKRRRDMTTMRNTLKERMQRKGEEEKERDMGVEREDGDGEKVGKTKGRKNGVEEAKEEDRVSGRTTFLVAWGKFQPIYSNVGAPI